MKQFLLERWICDNCDFEFYTKGYPDDLIVCPNCQESEQLSDGQTVKAQQWQGEDLK